MKNIKLKSLVLAAAVTCSSAFAASDAITDEQLQSAIEARLTEQLKNKEVAAYTAEFLMNEVLTWKGEPLAVNQADSILAYAFGNRLSANGNQTPGPMNKALAGVVVDLHKKTGKPVYAQWEIAQSIGDRIAPEFITSINPLIAEDGTVVYLSTTGVADEVVKQAGGADKLGKTLVVGFYEHSLRTIITSREAGIDAYAPQDTALPHDYDAQSGQAWTRDALTFVMHEIRNRATNQRTKLINEKLQN